ncbi:MAG: diaminopimelate decarboxylase [Sneathiellaceae bacterium]
MTSTAARRASADPLPVTSAGEPAGARPGAPHFDYRDGQLQAEGVPLARIAEEVGTPAFVYARNAVIATARRYQAALQGLPASICYAVKANGNGALLRSLAQTGLGADVVSGGEMHLAQRAGFAPGQIVFSGVGKTEVEIAAALQAGIAHLNVESETELATISRLAAEMKAPARILLRVNPDVAAATHAKIATGHKAAKFGVPLDRLQPAYARAAADPWLDPMGIAAHIGSQITTLDPYRKAFARLAGLIDDLRAAGLPVRAVDLGGGIGIRYRDEQLPDLAGYGALIREQFGARDVEIIVEPGRSMVGNAGLLLTRVLDVKHSGDKTFVVVDAAMNDLIRPTLYNAWHEILPVAAAPGAALVPVDVVGPVCESGDYLAQDRAMAEPVAGSLLAVMSAGAYSSVMASTYNARPLAPEVLVDGARFAIVRRRPSLAEMTALEALPDWLEDEAPGQGST